MKGDKKNKGVPYKEWAAQKVRKFSRADGGQKIEIKRGGKIVRVRVLAKRTLMALAAYADYDGTGIEVSIESIAEDVGIDERTVQRDIEVLVAIGELEVKYRKGFRGNGTNLFRIPFCQYSVEELNKLYPSRRKTQRPDRYSPPAQDTQIDLPMAIPEIKGSIVMESGGDFSSRSEEKGVNLSPIPEGRGVNLSKIGVNLSPQGVSSCPNRGVNLSPEYDRNMYNNIPTIRVTSSNSESSEGGQRSNVVSPIRNSERSLLDLLRETNPEYAKEYEAYCASQQVSSAGGLPVIPAIFEEQLSAVSDYERHRLDEIEAGNKSVAVTLGNERV